MAANQTRPLAHLLKARPDLRSDVPDSHSHRSILQPSALSSCLPSHLFCLPSQPNMAIHPEFRSQGPQATLSPQQTRSISAWTEQAATSLQGLTISDTRDEPLSIIDSTTARTGLRGASVSLAIPLDDDIPVTDTRQTSRVKLVGPSSQTQSVTFRRREPLRRDSLRRREALLKGKDGSRRRQRWENGMCGMWIAALANADD